MTLNEVLLIIACIAALVIPSLLLKRMRQRFITYVRLVSGLLLLILTWFIGDEGSLPIKVLMTTIVVSSAIKTIKDYKYFSEKTKRESN